MTRASFGLYLACLLAACASPQGVQEDRPQAMPGEQGSQPNFVVICIDDWGWRDAGFLGSQFYNTPRLDAFAGQGMVFTDAYSAAPNCAPSRASLMTGRYTPRHGILTVNSSKRGKARDRALIPIKNRRVLDDDEWTVAELLQQAGYATAMMGKWHLGSDPGDQGFDVHIAGNQSGHPESYFSPYGNPDLEDGPEGEYLTDRLTDEALRFLTEKAAEPFFLYLSHYAVHTPIQSRPDDAAPFMDKVADGGQNNADYAGMIAAVDRSVGRVLDALDELELSDKTVVILTSDNGGFGPVTSNAPLRGSKGMLFEGGIRVPFVTRWPGHIQPRSECAEPISGIDLLPTLADLAGVDLPQGRPIDGVSLRPLFEGRDISRDAIYWHFPVYLEADRTSTGPWRTTPAGAMRAGRWKLIEWFEDGRLELFDLYSDPSESHDLSTERFALTVTLGKRIDAWRRSVGARVPSEREPSYRKPD